MSSVALGQETFFGSASMVLRKYCTPVNELSRCLENYGQHQPLSLLYTSSQKIFFFFSHCHKRNRSMKHLKERKR